MNNVRFPASFHGQAGGLRRLLCISVLLTGHPDSSGVQGVVLKRFIINRPPPPGVQETTIGGFSFAANL
ncbi:MAG: hypothetical protein FMNOHCHN_00907 [Ignavibacteriaceae bacterium]|nr:hypothetical protein [Ignavibacteriaceae bacterium]